MHPCIHDQHDGQMVSKSMESLSDIERKRERERERESHADLAILAELLSLLPLVFLTLFLSFPPVLSLLFSPFSLSLYFLRH